MTEKLNFSVDATLIDRLGRELVSKQQTAMVELIKNSYDADATEVRVTLKKDVLIIADDGAGMSRDDLINGFLRLATDMKVREPTSTRYNRSRAGRKGIGRFSTQRLGDHLKLTTWRRGEPNGLVLTVDWRRFQQGKSLTDITVDLDEIDLVDEGTTIEITGLNDDWTDNQVRQCWRAVRNLQMPFAAGPIDGDKGIDPGFEVSFFRTQGIFEDETLVADFETEILSKMHSIVEFRVDDKGCAEWRISKNRFGPVTQWTKIHHENRDTQTPPKYSRLRSAWLKAHYAVLDPQLFSGYEYSRVREVLNEEGGIRLYSNGFRVVPYGEEDDDWLGLDATYARRGTVLAPVANRQWIGLIEVYDPEGERFEEHTSREGLIETKALEELRGLASTVLITAATQFASQRGRKTSAGGSSTRRSDELLEQLKAAAQKSQKNPQPDQDSDNATALLGEAKDVVEEMIAETNQQFADQAAILQLLASLGMTAAEFSHETGTTFQASGATFREALDIATEAKKEDAEFVKLAEGARYMFDRLNALTAYLNEVASARAAREIHPVSLSRSLNRFERGLKQLAKRQGIELDVESPPIGGLYTKPMHEAELASILLNLFSNSSKAVKSVARPRRIFAECGSEEDEVVLRFSDTGDGIPEENEEKVFDLFFTTRVAAPSHSRAIDDAIGTGLGLWIVKQIVDRVGGQVAVIPPPEGFTTCFEVRLPARG